MRRTSSLLLLVAVLAALPARAEPAPPAALIVTPNFSFLPGSTDRYPVPLEVAQGGTVAHLNVDPQAVIASSWGQHAVMSDATDAQGDPLFWSDLVGFGGVAIVNGVEKLPPGSYAFYCRAHGDLMNGVLEVVAL